MKKVIITLLGIFSVTLIFSQTGVKKPATTSKIVLSNGQKIIVESTISLEANLSMGMELTSNSTSENTLEVKANTAKNYTISSTLTKLKVNMNMMGQPTNYDSEKKEDNNSDMAKTFDEKMNNPVNVILDNSTGVATMVESPERKVETDDENSMSGLLNMFSESTDEAVVSGAFELIPKGKSIGDSWSDTTVEKEQKSIRTYTLKSVTDNEALLQLDMVTIAAAKVDVQGMEMEFKSNTKTNGEVTTDITTGQVRKKNTKSDITGSFQLMGQDVPITAKVSTTSTYK